MASMRSGRIRALIAFVAAAVATMALVAGAAAQASRSAASTASDVVRSCGKPAHAGDAVCFAMHRTDVATHKGITANATPSGYGPADLQSAYALPSAAAGSGQTVAIVDAFDDPNAEADLAVYRAQFGLLPCTAATSCFRKVDENGGTNYPSTNAGWSEEISLDLDMVSAICPNCHILLVEANTANVGDLGQGVDTAVELGAKYVSNSYGSQYNAVPGSGEHTEDVQDNAFYNHAGVAVVASSGDSHFGVAYPAASPFVTSVGGTSLTRDTGTPRGWTEKAWNGAGSGCSIIETKPTFQTDTGCADRTVADVSAVADPATGVSVYDTFEFQGWSVFGGTSVASPIIASTYALAGAPTAGTYPNAYPYEHTNALNDVTSGSNGTCTPSYLCTSGPGYDGPTGLGTPDGLTAFTESPHGTVVGHVTDASTGKPVVGGVVVDGGSSAVTRADGSYELFAPAGEQHLAAQGGGYGEVDKTVTVPDGGTVTVDFALTKVPSVPVSGTVTDGSGHGWPLYASITVDGIAQPPVFTDPFTGAYQMSLPESNTFTVHITPVYPGYQTLTAKLAVGTTAANQGFSVTVAGGTCTAPGYARSGATCTATPGGLVAGLTTRSAGGAPVVGVSVRDEDAPADSGVSAATPQDAALPDGFYWLFSSLTGSHPFTALANRYQPATTPVDVAADAVTRADIALAAGHLSISPASVSASLPLGGSTQQTITVHNTGDATAHLTIGEQSGGLEPLDSAAAGSPPVQRITGQYTLLPPESALTAALRSAAREPNAAPANTGPAIATPGGWVDKTPLPTSISLGTTSAYNPDDGRVYTVSTTGFSGSLFAYDPVADRWTQLAPPPTPVNVAAAGFVDGKFVVAGGFLLATTGPIVAAAPTAALQIYDPATNRWTAGPDLPEARAASGAAVLDGHLYVVAGCQYSCVPNASDVYRYDPEANSWHTLAKYPLPAAGLACAGVDGEIVCAGGARNVGLLTVSDQPAPSVTRHTYIYNPRTDTWSQAADLPIDLWGASYSAANGMLVLTGGVTGQSTEVTNQSFAFDPTKNVWTALPNANHAGFDGSGACGFFAIGSRTSLFGAQPVQQLPGFTDCSDGANVPWLSASPRTLTIPAGGSAKVTVTLDAGATEVNQPGDYTARLELTSDTPDRVNPLDVTMTVDRPSGWGKITGTVSATTCGGSTAPLAGVTVQIDGAGHQPHTVTTDAAGKYALWLNQREDPLTVIASKSGWRIRTGAASVRQGASTVADFILTPQLPC